MNFTYSLKVFAFTAVFVSLTGCGIKEASSNIEEAAKQVDSAAGKLQTGAEATAKALSEFDPTGFRALISTNELLRKQLGTIRDRLRDLPTGAPVVVLRGRKVTAEIVQYTGSFRINAWIDSKENWFWQERRFDDKEVRLRMEYGKVTDDFVRQLRTQAKKAAIHVPLLGIDQDEMIDRMTKQMFFRNRTQLVEKYRSAVEASFEDFLRNSAIVPSPDERGMEMQSSFLTLGEHTVHFEACPIKADRNNRWSLRGRIVSVGATGAPERIKEFDIDSDNPLYRGHEPGKPLPPIKAFLFVE